jgi:Transcriptional regulation of mitochondrial recombination
MQNLYLFRNIQTHKVLVSPRFQMQPAILRQIGEHRPQLGIRGDLWIPFAVVTGLQKQQAQWLTNRLTFNFKMPLGRQTMPLPTKVEFPGWKVPAAVANKSDKLCKLMSTPDCMEVLEVESTEAETVETNKPNITIHWEREEFREAATEGNAVWPSYITHARLRLIRNRFPVVPGFCNKARNDIHPDPLPALKRKKGYAITRADKASKERRLKRDEVYIKPKRILVPVVEKAQWSGKTWIRKSRAAGMVEGASMPNGTRKPRLNGI